MGLALSMSPSISRGPGPIRFGSIERRVSQSISQDVTYVIYLSLDHLATSRIYALSTLPHAKIDNQHCHQKAVYPKAFYRSIPVLFLSWIPTVRLRWPKKDAMVAFESTVTVTMSVSSCGSYTKP